MVWSRRWSGAALLSLCLVGTALESHATLFGPWRRYRNEQLGFQLPYVDDWVITPLQNCVVFAMQINPDPYVRLAVGRIPADGTDFETSVHSQITQNHQAKFLRTNTELGGWPAIRVEGDSDTSHMLDYYVDRGAYRYWVSIVADGPQTWKDYEPNVEIVLRDLRFL